MRTDPKIARTSNGNIGFDSGNLIVLEPVQASSSSSAGKVDPTGWRAGLNEVPPEDVLEHALYGALCSWLARATNDKQEEQDFQAYWEAACKIFDINLNDPNDLREKSGSLKLKADEFMRNDVFDRELDELLARPNRKLVGTDALARSDIIKESNKAIELRIQSKEVYLSAAYDVFVKESGECFYTKIQSNFEKLFPDFLTTSPEQQENDKREKFLKIVFEVLLPDKPGPMRKQHAPGQLDQLPKLITGAELANGIGGAD